MSVIPSEPPVPNPVAYSPVAMSYKDQQDLVATVLDWKKKIKNGRVKLENQWNLNLAFFAGKQNVTTIAGAGGLNRLTVGKSPYWRSRKVFNHIRPLMRTELSKLTSQKPTAVVVPNSQDDDDVFAAEAAQAVYEGIYQGKKLDREIRRAMFWTVITGTGFLKVLWDPMAVDVASDQLGDLKITPEMPYNVYVPDFRCETLEEQPYVIHSQTFPVEKVRAMLSNVNGFDASKIVADSKSTEDPLATVWLELESNKTEFEDTVEVLEVWIKPGTDRRWENGAMMTIASGQLIQYVEGWPYQHGMYPFIKFSGIPNGKFYADSTIVDLIPVQQEYNRTRNQIIEAKNTMAKPQLIAPQGSVDASKITTEPGQVIFYKPGLNPPEPLPLQPLPSYVMDEVERLYRDFEDISGQHEISKGSPPAGVTAATAISFLSEQDDAKLTPQVRELETGIEVMGHQILSLVSQFWETPRVVKQVGADSSFNAAVFKGSDLRGNTDLRVEAGSALAGSKAARQAFIMDNMKMGFIPVDIGLELLEMGNIASLYERVKVDERQAQRENLRMSTLDVNVASKYIDNRAAWETMGGVDSATGQTIMPPKPPYPVNDFDDHGKHIDAHNRFRKSQAYEQLPDTLKAVIDEHVNAHVAALMQGMPETMAGSTQPTPDTPTEQMQSPNGANYSGPQSDSVTGSQQPPSGG